MNFALQALELADSLGVPFFLEHPDDLGVYRTGEVPAIIWRLPELKDLARISGAARWALHQKSYGATYAKPTGILSSFKLDEDFGVKGWPAMGPTGRYTGPLPNIRAANMQMGPEHTAKTAAHPAKLCHKGRCLGSGSGWFNGVFSFAKVIAAGCIRDCSSCFF